MQTDIELAIVGLGKDRFQELMKKLPGTYTVEDRSSTGYGFVVRSELSEDSAEINAKIENFLKGLMSLTEAIKGRDCILRIVIFNSLLTTTITFSAPALEMLLAFKANLEISIYPTEDESQQSLNDLARRAQ